MASKNAKAARDLFDSWERRDFKRLESLLGESVTYADHGQGTTLKGKGEVREWFEGWAKACPDSKADPAVIAESPDTAVVRGTWVGTNTGPLGPMPATGKRVSLPFINVVRFDGPGKIVEGEAYYDQMSMLVQLGHMQAPA